MDWLAEEGMDLGGCGGAGMGHYVVDYTLGPPPRDCFTVIPPFVGLNPTVWSGTGGGRARSRWRRGVFSLLRSAVLTLTQFHARAQAQLKCQLRDLWGQSEGGTEGGRETADRQHVLFNFRIQSRYQSFSRVQSFPCFFLVFHHRPETSVCERDVANTLRSSWE